jgi:hypothetical protein
MTEKTKIENEHKDRLGRQLKIGDCIAVAHRNGLMVGVIKKAHPKMISVSELDGKDVNGRYWRGHDYKKYSSECVLLEGPEVTLYLLKHATAEKE